MSDDDGLEELISEEMLWDRIPEVKAKNVPAPITN